MAYLCLLKKLNLLFKNSPTEETPGSYALTDKNFLGDMKKMICCILGQKKNYPWCKVQEKREKYRGDHMGVNLNKY